MRDSKFCPGAHVRPNAIALASAIRTVTACLAMLLFPLSVMAAPTQVPNAGRSIRDIESIRPAQPPAAAPELDLPQRQPQSEPPADAHAARLAVSAFYIDGNEVFPQEELLRLLDDLKGKPLTLAELRAAAERVTDYYRTHGYVLARAFLPPQEIEDGRVHISVQEGRYDRIILENRSRTRDGVLQQPLRNLKPGEPIYGPDLERTLLLISDVPGVTAKGTLRPGEQSGSTALVVETESAPLLNGSVDADNYGSFYTGEYRLTGNVNVNSPLRLGDRLDLRLLGSNGRQHYYRAAYQVRVGTQSTQLGVGYSSMSYHLGKDFEVLEAHGTASVRSVFATQPLIRSRTFNLNAQFQYEDKRLRDDIDLYGVSAGKRVELWTLSLDGSRDDDFLGGGRSYFYLGYGSGQLRFGNAFDGMLDARTARTSGRFSKLTFSGGRLQRLPGRLQLLAQANAQWASGNLDSSEKLGLGGPYGVRAYALGAGSGDQGWVASAELRYALAAHWTISAFIDNGVISVNKHPWVSGSNEVRLAASGVGANWTDRNQQVSLTAAWPLGAREVNDVPKRDPRIWLHATQYF